MKKLILILFILLSINSFGQDQKDTGYVCIPNYIAKEILLDLNELDRLKEIDTLSKNEIVSLEKKINLKDSTIIALKEKDSLNQDIIINLEEMVSLVEEENKILEKNIKKIKVKNRVFQAISGAIIGTLTYLLIF